MGCYVTHEHMDASAWDPTAQPREVTVAVGCLELYGLRELDRVLSSKGLPAYLKAHAHLFDSPAKRADLRQRCLPDLVPVLYEDPTQVGPRTCWQHHDLLYGMLAATARLVCHVCSHACFSEKASHAYDDLLLMQHYWQCSGRPAVLPACSAQAHANDLRHVLTRDARKWCALMEALRVDRARPHPDRRITHDFLQAHIVGKCTAENALQVADRLIVLCTAPESK